MTVPPAQPPAEPRELPPPVPPPDRPPRLRRYLPLLVMIVVMIGGAVLIGRNWSSLSESIHKVGVAVMIGSFVLSVAGTACIGQVWQSALSGLGAHAPQREAAAVFFVSQLGKYLPGSVWPVLAQMEFGRRSGTPRRTMLAANLLMLAVVTATGLVTAAALLPWSSADGLHRYWWTLLLLLPLLVSLHPRVIPSALDGLFRLAKRPPLGLRVTNRGMVRACAWGFAVWILLGAHLLVMTRALGAYGTASVAAAIGGMALAFATGLIFIPAPAGAGVRDGILVATFSVQIGSTNALAVALASRVLLILADVGLAGAGALLGRGRWSGRGGLSGGPAGHSQLRSANSSDV